jgi:hypothetical protein
MMAGWKKIKKVTLRRSSYKLRRFSMTFALHLP